MALSLKNIYKVTSCIHVCIHVYSVYKACVHCTVYVYTVQVYTVLVYSASPPDLVLVSHCR